MVTARSNATASRIFAAACALSLLASITATAWAPGLGAALAGWLLALAQAVAAMIIHRRAVSATAERFLALSLGSMALRTLFLLGLLAVVRATAVLPFAPFAAALLLSHLILLYAETARLHLAPLPVAPVQHPA